MKKLKALNSLALAGVAVVMTGCSSTNMSSNDDGSAYRTVGAGGWVPITYASEMNKFPIEWNPVFYETYRLTVPVADSAATARAEADVADLNNDAIVELEPGATFVEAAGADGETRVRRVILHTPFQQ
jgi:hypothetical protein